MASSDRSLLIETRTGEVQLEARFAQPLKVIFKEVPHEDNNYEVGNEAFLLLNTSEIDELIKALEYLKS